MANCSCPQGDPSLTKLCAECNTKFLRTIRDAEAQDQLAKQYGCTPETLGLTETEERAAAQADAADRYEPSERTPEFRLDVHARKLADIELRMKAQAETIATLNAAVHALVALAMERRPA